MAYKFGHLIEFINGNTVYQDSGAMIKCDSVGGPWKYPSTRSCPKCKLLPTEEGHDPCLANLSGVCGACCGHGVGEGYIRFESGHVIRGNFNIKQPEHEREKQK